MYTPDCWVIVEIDHEGVIYHKVLAGWSGGYLDGDSWRMNSGINGVEVDGDYYLIHGYSGSIYKVHKDAETVRMSISGVLNQLESSGKAKMISIKELL